MWIFQIVVPFHRRALLGVTPHQLERFGHHVDGVRTAKSNAVLRLQPKDAFHRILLFPGSPATARTEVNLDRRGAAAISSQASDYANGWVCARIGNRFHGRNLT